MSGAEVLGEIDIDSDRPAAFGQADRALLEAGRRACRSKPHGLVTAEPQNLRTAETANL